MLVNLNQPKTLPHSKITILPVPLRRSDPTSPWCYSASLSPPLNEDDDVPPLPPGTNFLATQVWPSSRTASYVIEKYCNPSWTVCELGCGPGLPSLTAAHVGASVIATDVDVVALEMVKAAAVEQGFIDGEQSEGRFVTRQFDLTKKVPLPEADLYVLSDVFESAIVAEGAAWHVTSVLNESNKTSRVWVFAQSDRAQRDAFLNSMRKELSFEQLEWKTDHNPTKDSRIWLFDLNEMDVQYN